MSSSICKSVLKLSTSKSISRKISEQRVISKDSSAPNEKLAQRRKRSLSLDPQILLQWAATHNDVDTLKTVLEGTNVDINEPGLDGFYPLHRAASTGSFESLQYLVTKGAQLDVRDKDGSSPLDAAVNEGEFDCARFLIEKGANINHIRDGFTDKNLHGGRKRAMTIE
ncbi:hypothetical protein OS493_021206 [Desmophyllum pertusum]|uniref:Myotrophin n=1 Tax=Desmophyllum pertusum TaxID=174260 RepID=A0A9W9ZNE2_9CNID|nr:hypothetical protein OS493_021206 [Desmophyllum pertusum]